MDYLFFLLHHTLRKLRIVHLVKMFVSMFAPFFLFDQFWLHLGVSNEQNSFPSVIKNHFQKSRNLSHATCDQFQSHSCFFKGMESFPIWLEGLRVDVLLLLNKKFQGHSDLVPTRREARDREQTWKKPRDLELNSFHHQAQSKLKINWGWIVFSRFKEYNLYCIKQNAMKI